MPLKPVSLDDKYDLGKDRVFVTGFQALVRLCLMQKERDRRAGLNTAGYVTGYRGSPLGTLDQQFMRAGARLKANDIMFHPGTNEDLAATALSAPSTRSCAAKASSMACSACGTARGRASTARATPSATPTSPAPRSMAASSP